MWKVFPQDNFLCNGGEGLGHLLSFQNFLNIAYGLMYLWCGSILARSNSQICLVQLNACVLNSPRGQYQQNILHVKSSTIEEWLESQGKLRCKDTKP